MNRREKTEQRMHDRVSEICEHMKSVVSEDGEPMGSLKGKLNDFLVRKVVSNPRDKVAWAKAGGRFVSLVTMAASKEGNGKTPLITGGTAGYAN